VLDNVVLSLWNCVVIKLTMIVIAFAIGWFCNAIWLRFGKAVQRQQPRRPASSRIVHVGRPTFPTISPWVSPAKSAAATESREVQRLRAKLAAASQVCQLAGRGQQLDSMLAQLDGRKP
jgi:hypothetical protein